MRGTECVNALHRRARAHAAMGDTPAALADVRSAVDRLELARSRLVPADFLKQQFTEAQAAIYSDAIALQFGAQQGRDALETAERARARAFIDLLAANDLAAPAGGSVEPKVTPPSPADDAIVFRGASRPPAAAARDTDATAADRRTRIPAKAADASELAAVAARLNSTLLVYWVADDELFIWIVKAGGEIRAARVAVRAPALRELVQSAMPISVEGSTSTIAAREARIATRGEMTIAVPRAPHAAWRQLHDLLIRPVRDSLPRPGTLLTIVPHGPLAQLSFAALQNERGRYLLEDYPLHYIPAVAVLQFTAAKRRSDAREGAIMLVADPRLPARSRLERPLPPLPGARTEVAAISRFVRRDRVTLLEGQAATESAIRTAASDKTVLHFATHAIVDDSQPFTSFLALRPTAATAASDGALTAREIYGIELRADLVVLSACRSGSAHVTGDGIATFARAFIYAGTPSVITSLWDVADQPTNQLLTGFYRRWFGRASKARALRAAALALLADLRAGNVRIETAAGEVTVPEHPVFWAGFVLIGEPD